MRLANYLVALNLFAVAQSAAAENPIVTTDDLLKDPKSYLKQPVSFTGAYCYKAEHGYECRTDAPLRLWTAKMPDGIAKATIDKDCGQLDAIELSPGCGFTLQMVPTESTTMEGDYVRDGQQVTGRITVVTVTVTAAKKE
jgi:hypothetical protein